jgi:hypothetical protein
MTKSDQYMSSGDRHAPQIRSSRAGRHRPSRHRLASSTAEARDRSQDHRGVPPVVGQAKPTENFAIPSGWRVKCVLPFCGHDFNPSRERERDHRSAPHKRPK